MSGRDLNKLLNKTPYTQERGLMPKQIIFSDSQINKIINLYKDGSSCKQIGKIFKCSRQVINKTLRNNNISIRDYSHSGQQYKINENIFETIDTKEKAYWLGMLTGDGCITNRNDLSLSLEQSDKYLIYEFRKFLSSNHPIRMINNRPKKDGSPSISCELKITNKKIVSDLRKYNFHSDKTHFMEFPKISEELLSNYMLGLVDSDGCFCLKTHYKNKNIKSLSFSFVGPTQFVEKFQYILINKCNVSKTKLNTYKNTNFIRMVNYGGYKHIFSIVKFLYSDTTICMNRKKKIAIKFLINKFPDDQWLIEQLKDTSSSEAT